MTRITEILTNYANNKEYTLRMATDDINALIASVEAEKGKFTFIQMVDFADYLQKLRPSDRVTVHTSVGPGVRDLTTSEILERWMRKQATPYYPEGRGLSDVDLTPKQRANKTKYFNPKPEQP